MKSLAIKLCMTGKATPKKVEVAGPAGTKTFVLENVNFDFFLKEHM